MAFIFCLRSPAHQNRQLPAPTPATKIQVTVNAVLVPVVVRDSQGRAIANLTKDDFKIFEGKKPQVISGFSIQQKVPSEIAATPVLLPPATSSNAAPQITKPPQRYVVLLFDDLHFEAGDLARIQEIAKKVVAQSLSESDMVAVVSFSGTYSGMTRDRAKLQQAISELKMHGLYRHVAHECPDIDYYQGDLILNKNSSQALDAAVEETLTCGHTNLRSAAEAIAESAARRAVVIGDQDVRVTLDFVANLVRRMGTLAGQREIILVSPGFLTITPEAMSEKSQVLDLAAQSNVVISALDARGLYTTNLDASQRGPSSPLALATSNQSDYHSSAMNLSEDVMAEFAEGTGGTFFHNSNDLTGGLQRLTALPECVYILELSLANIKPDGAYHSLKVKVDRDGVNIQARRGYFAPKPQKN
jgi:VWFA-related protein